MRQNLYPSLYFRQLGTLVTIPAGNTDKVRIPRWLNVIDTKGGVSQISAGAGGLLSAIHVNSGESYPTSGGVMCAESLCGQAVQFHGYKRYNDRLALITKANFLEGALESLSRELAFKIDRYDRVALTGSGIADALFKHIHPPATTNKLPSTAVLTGKNVSKFAPWMDSGNSPAWDDESFVFITNPLARYDLLSDISATGFVSIARYNDAMRIYKGEIGQMYGIRFLLSTSIPILFGGATSGTNGLSGAVTGAWGYLIGPDAYYTIEIEDGGVEVFHMPPGSGGATGDPAAKIGSISVKCWHGIVRNATDDKRYRIINHALGLRS